LEDGAKADAVATRVARMESFMVKRNTVNKVLLFSFVVKSVL
jgi:hypothetical protein